MENYIFSGFGHASGKYKITNEEIIEAVRKDYLKGFREDRIERSENYAKFKRTHPNVSAFDYFAGYKMGFFTRHHVTPFPPTRKKLYYAETSLGLGVKAINDAITDAGLQINDIAAWFASTVSPHEQAPGIASTIKAYFTDFDNDTPCMSLTSGCSGFNINLERAIEYLKQHKNAKHVVVAHTETMSSFLTQRMKFIPFVTFGDAAAAVILSKSEDDKKEGVLEITNYHDMRMIDFVGVDKQSNLYMEDSVIKDRAIINMIKSGKEILTKTDWETKEVDTFIPHQTGSAILLPTAQNIGLTDKQLFLEPQKEYGNVSGATVAIGLSMLNEQNRLIPGMKILSTVAGVGGNYGGFTYLTPQQKNTEESTLHYQDLINKTAVICGASGALGQEIAIELGKRGAKLILHYHNDKTALQAKLETINLPEKPTFIQADFIKQDSLLSLIDNIKANTSQIDYLIHAAGVSENLNETSKTPDADKIMEINHFAPIQITKALQSQLKETVLFLGTTAEDIPISGFPGFTASKSALHGAVGSAAGELISKGIRSIYYMPAMLDDGISRNIPTKIAFHFMMKNGQEKPVSTQATAERIVSSLYIPKVLGTHNTYEGPMLVRRDGYVLETDV
ncbi:MAG: SDR family NAD(P)-dependent oxidoreductase [Bacteroidota bacterium]|nr:SDR family NAD(P)-dependent oxidoreductase [Bacteroidota bacterium]